MHMLETMRAGGRKLFLATNSLWDYTNVVMNYLLLGKTCVCLRWAGALAGGRRAALRVHCHDHSAEILTTARDVAWPGLHLCVRARRGSNKSTDWLRYFDVVMVGCGKPAFFTPGAGQQLFHVDIKSGLWSHNPRAPFCFLTQLRRRSLSSCTVCHGASLPPRAPAGLLSNTDNGAPILPVDEADRADPAPPGMPGLGAGADAEPPAAAASFAGQPQVFQGGSYRDLHRMLGVASGDQVLYVGDHIYGDIVKAKKAIGWRTMLVVPELQLELQLQEETKVRRCAHTQAALCRAHDAQHSRNGPGAPLLAAA